MKAAAILFLVLALAGCAAPPKGNDPEIFQPRGTRSFPTPR